MAAGRASIDHDVCVCYCMLDDNEPWLYSICLLLWDTVLDMAGHVSVFTLTYYLFQPIRIPIKHIASNQFEPLMHRDPKKTLLPHYPVKPLKPAR